MSHTTPSPAENPPRYRSEPRGRHETFSDFFLRIKSVQLPIVNHVGRHERDNWTVHDAYAAGVSDGHMEEAYDRDTAEIETGFGPMKVVPNLLILDDIDGGRSPEGQDAVMASWFASRSSQPYPIVEDCPQNVWSPYGGPCVCGGQTHPA